MSVIFPTLGLVLAAVVPGNAERYNHMLQSTSTSFLLSLESKPWLKITFVSGIKTGNKNNNIMVINTSRKVSLFNFFFHQNE